MSTSPKPSKPAASTLVRKSSTDGQRAPAGTSAATAASPNAAAASAASLKVGLKKLSVSGDSDQGTITPVKNSQAGASSPANRPRVSPAASPAGSVALKSAASSGPASPTAAAPRRASGTSSMSAAAPSSAAASAQARTIMKAPVQSPTAAGMKMRPASGTGLNNLSSIGVSAMAAAAANPYSSSLSQSPVSSPSSGGAPSPSSPIASLSPNARRYKTASTPTGAGSSQPQAASSPIHSISQSGASAGSRSAYAPAGSVASSNGASSYRAQGVHPPVNTHAHPPQGHVADHNAPGGGPTIFSPVYSRTASQEQLHQAEEMKKKQGAGRTEQQQREDAEAQYRHQQQQAAAQYAAQQQQAAAQAQAAAAAQAAAHQQSQGKHTVSYTPPPVEEDEFDPFLFIKNLPPLSPAMRNRRSPLPKKSLSAPKITLALDLDETLVHCSVQPIERAELTFKVAFNGMDYEVYVRTRPHMKEFLETVSQWFEVIIFTASQKVYADKLLNILDPQGTYIKYRVFRDSCVCVDGNYLKDLHILGRDLPTVAIVDNSVQAFGFQLDNGIPIESWFDDDQDRELLNLIPFLRTLKDVKDVRPLIRDTFRLTEFVASL